MSAHALMSLRGEKYGDEWAPVWEHFGAQPLDKDTAVAQVVDSLSDEGLTPGSGLAESIVYELMADAEAIGLDQDHIAKLAEVVGTSEGERREVLEHVTDRLAWERSTMADWGTVMDRVTPIARKDLVKVTARPDAPPVSLASLTSSLSSANLLSGPPVPEGTSCDSKNVTGGLDGTATTVYGEFEVAGNVADFAYACNPVNWPKCSWFFIHMLEQPAPPSVPLDPPDDVGGVAYQAVMEEKVGMTGILTVTTLLTCRYFVGQKSVGMEFDLEPGTHGDGKIDVDHGYLLAEQVDPNTVRVRSQKTFSFVGLDDLPFTWLCSFGWIDMMRGMATCRP